MKTPKKHTDPREMDMQRAMLDELERLRQERAHKEKRLQRLLAHRPLPGCGRIAAQARQRYVGEIEELDRTIGMLEANLEGMGVAL